MESSAIMVLEKPCYSKVYVDYIGWMKVRKVGLDPLSKKRVCNYSLGMRQRLAIAQAIMEEQPILILDEPMNGLDKRGVSEMRDFFKELKNQGKTILMASHNKEDIDVLCDRVYEMDAGVLTMVR